MKPASVIAACASLGVILVAGAGIYIWKHRPQPAPPAFQEPPQAVEIVAVKAVPFTPMADLTGTVIALRSVNISNEVAGVVKSMNFSSGSIVEQGQVILTIDDTTQRADLAAAESAVRVAVANVAVADARFALAKTEYDRMAGATQSGAAPAMELDRAKAEYEKAKADRDRWAADVDQSKAVLAQVKTRLDKMVIKAPFRARVGLRNIHEGQYLKEGTEIVRLEEVGDKINLDFAIPQEYIARVQPGTVVMATSNVFGDQPVRIEVTALDAVVSYDTRNIRVRSIVDNPNGILRPGMSVSIRVPVDLPTTVLTVPTTALRRASYADSVFVVTQDKDGLRAHQRFIKAGAALGTETIITDGLKAGENVAAAGSFKLHEGAPVMDGPPPGAPGPGGPPAADKH